MRNLFGRFVCLLLAALMIFSLFSACSDRYEGADTLIVGRAQTSDMLGAFFATDDEMNALVYDRLIARGSEGEYILSGAENAVADCTVEMSGKKAVFSFTVREDIRFSDGETLDADDIIFSMYVLADPSYDGPSSFGELPIVGLSEYRSGMVEKWRLIYSDIAASLLSREPVHENSYSNDEMAQFVNIMNEAGETFARNIVDYCLETFAASSQNYFDRDADEFHQNEGLAVAMTMHAWGAGELDGETGEFVSLGGESFDLEESYPDYAHFWQQLMLGDITQLAVADVSYESILTDLIEREYPQFLRYSDNGEAVRSISGIKKTGKMSLSVTMTQFDSAVFDELSIYIAPMHYYVDKSEFDCEKEKFGFEKGDISGIRTRESVPVGSGAYEFSKVDGSTVFLRASKYYRLGKATIENIIVKQVADDDALNAIQSGDIDLASFCPDMDEYQRLLSRSGQNGFLYLDDYTRSSYGYIGLNAERIAVDDNAQSYESKMLRRGIAIIFGVYRELAVDSYFSGYAVDVQYPVPPSSWTFPDELTDPYSLDTDGRNIYSENMSENERISAAIEAAQGCFEAAGIEKGECRYTLAFCCESDYHPAYDLACMAAETLGELGVELDIKRTANADLYFERLQNGEYDMWAASWDTLAEPDLSCYHSTCIDENNYYAISDSRLDELIVRARSTADPAERERIYAQCYETILDWAVEIPLYSTKEVTVCSNERVDVATLDMQFTIYRPWTSVAHDIEMLPRK